MKQSPLIFLSFVLVLLTAFCGCAGRGPLYLRDELANVGAIPLSPQNPYLAANLFVAREMEHSSVFRGFIEHRGAPDAVEIRKRTMKPLKVFLFYLDDFEAYSFTESHNDWLIRGPEKISPRLMSAFFNAPSARGRPALLGEDFEESPRVTDRQKPRVSQEPPLVSPQPFAMEKSSASASPSKNVRSKANPAPRTKKPARPSKEENLMKPQATAEESSSGDLIHKITFEGETLRIISAWYTGEAKNSDRIGRINGIENPNSLQVGQTLRIPRYMLKTATPLPQAALSVENTPW